MYNYNPTLLAKCNIPKQEICHGCHVVSYGFLDMTPQFMDVPGTAKPWLSWNGERAVISDLDTYVLNHRRRMKPCTAFDKLDMDSGENQAFGTPDRDYVHFATDIADALMELKDKV